MQIVFLVLIFLLGICFGSFLCCQARRLHLRQSPKPPKLQTRSICLSCHRQVHWYDNIPIVSWLLLRGKCRYCHKPIGVAEILSELGLGLAFLAVGSTFSITTTSILAWSSFIFTLIFVVIVGFLAIYDGLYGELPVVSLTSAIACAIIILTLDTWHTLTIVPFSIDLIWKPLASVLVLGGLYLFLYLISKGRWVGDGDWLLATALALVLADPWLALITLCLANLIACIVMLPFLKKTKSRKIYFGPFLVIAFVIVFALQSVL